MIDIIEKKIWLYACSVNDVPENGGVCIKYEDKQIAVFNFTSRGEWYATQNLCPHKNQLALSRGILGDKNGELKIACPYHKKTFSLLNGCNLDGDNYKIKIYPIKVENDMIFIEVDK